MTLRSKIFLGYGIPLGLVLLVLIWGLVHLWQLGRASDAILRDNYRSILAAERMLAALERQDSLVLLWLAGGSGESLPAEFREQETQFLQWLGRARDNVTIAGEIDLTDALGPQYTLFLRACDELKDQPRIDRYQQSVQPHFLAVRDSIEALRELNSKIMYAASGEAQLLAHQAMISSMVVGTVGLTLGLLFSILLSSRITRPLQRLADATRRVARGDKVRLPAEGSDELAMLARDFNQMADALAAFHALNVEKMIAQKLKAEAVLNGIDEGIVLIRPDRLVESMNPSAERLLGRGGRPRPRALADLLRDPALDGALDRLLAGGDVSAMEEERRIISFDGEASRRHLLFSLTAIRNDRGELSGVVLLLRDVTRLKELDRLKSEFVMAASHELRTPLTSIGMSVALLREHLSPTLAAQDRELLDAAHEETQRLKALVNDLLDLSKIEAGRIDMLFERTPVKPLAERMEHLFRDQCAAKAVTLSCTVPPQLPDLRADASKVAWVLSNLVANALRYVPAGGNIRVTAQAAGAQVHLSVSDDGPGIPREHQSRIFQKFVQLPGSPGGAGLGLAICKEIVRAHGGTIWVQSTPGEGTTFTFSLPAFGSDVPSEDA